MRRPVGSEADRALAREASPGLQSCSRRRPACCRSTHRRVGCSWPGGAPTTSASSRAAGRSPGRGARARRRTGTTIAARPGASGSVTASRSPLTVLFRAQDPCADGDRGRGRATVCRGPRRLRHARPASRGPRGHGAGPASGRPAHRGACIPGRPVMLDEIRSSADAVVAAWLPGTEGAGVPMPCSGTPAFTATTPYTWPLTPAEAPRTGKGRRRRAVSGRLRPRRDGRPPRR